MNWSFQRQFTFYPFVSENIDYEALDIIELNDKIDIYCNLFSELNELEAFH